MARAVVWLYLGPLIVIGGLGLLAFGFGLLAVAAQLVGALLTHVGI